MNKERSPNYPRISLDEAVKKAQSLFKAESRTAVPPLVAVKAWGYSGLSGISRGMIAALRQYNLVDTEKNGSVKVSGLGLTLSMRSPSSPEYSNALKDAAMAPSIFREISETKNGASDEALKHYLVANKGFSPDGAKRVIASYRATVEYAKLNNHRFDNLEDEPESTVEESNFDEKHISSHNESKATEGERYRWLLSGEVVAEVIFTGGKITSRELKLLREYLILMEKALDKLEGVDKQEPSISS